MKFLSHLFFIIVFSFNVFGAEIEAELHLIPEVNILKEGDLVTGLIKIWPIENADLAEFRQIENMTFANILTVTSVESLEISPNNADVIEVKVLMIAKQLEASEATPLTYKGQVIQLKVQPLKVEDSGKKSEDYFIMDQGIISSYLGIVIAGFIFFTLFVTALLKRKEIKKYIQNFRSNPTLIAMKKYNEMFMNAKSRVDYEGIYASQKDWLTLVKVQAPAYFEFFKIMEQHQYKKHWTEDELSEVSTCFDVIRGSFK
jgi:hypothetical protein